MDLLTSQVEEAVGCSSLGQNRPRWCLTFLKGMFILASAIQSEAKVVVAAAFIQIITFANTQYPEPLWTKVVWISPSNSVKIKTTKRKQTNQEVSFEKLLLLLLKTLNMINVWKSFSTSVPVSVHKGQILQKCVRKCQLWSPCVFLKLIVLYFLIHINITVYHESLTAIQLLFSLLRTCKVGVLTNGGQPAGFTENK